MLLEGKPEKLQAQIGANITAAIINSLASRGIKDTLTPDIYLCIEHGKEGRWGAISSNISEVGSNSNQHTGTKNTGSNSLGLSKENGPKPKVHSVHNVIGPKPKLFLVPKDIGPKPNLSVWKPINSKQDGMASKPKSQH